MLTVFVARERFGCDARHTFAIYLGRCSALDRNFGQVIDRGCGAEIGDWGSERLRTSGCKFVNPQRMAYIYKVFSVA